MSPRTWLSVLGVSVLVILGLFVVPALTQTEKGKKYALLVGVNKYRGAKFPALKFAQYDVTELADALEKHGGFSLVRVLSNTNDEKNTADRPTAANIRKEIQALVAKKVAEDTLLIGLAGHGLQLEVEDPETDKNKKGRPRVYSYFCPHDADLTDEVSYSTGKCASLVQLSEVFDAPNKSGAGTRLVLVDACRDEMRASNVTRSAADLDIDQLRVPKGIGAMFSCSAGERARETADLGKGHGVFFHHIIEGLRGEAKNRKGLVTWDSLADYVKDEVPAYVKDKIGFGARQKPAALGHLEGAAVLARFDVTPSKNKGDKSATPGKEAVVKDKDTFTNSLGMKFVRVKAGSFTMGSPKGEADRDDKDEDEHEVELTKDYFMQTTEVTQKQWLEVMGGKNPSYFCVDGDGKDKVKGKNTDDFPVENVSWKDTETFLEKLNARAAEKKYKVRYTLPSEAQWEYACRGGHLIKKLGDKARLPFHFQTPSDSLGTGDANFYTEYPYGKGKKSDYLGRAHLVAKNGEANALGLFDMHGNVWEWCSDWYDAGYYGTPASLKDPTGPKDPPKGGSYRVIRGGSWDDGGQYCRAAARDGDGPESRYCHLGFRLAAVPHE